MIDQHSMSMKQNGYAYQISFMTAFYFYFFFYFLSPGVFVGSVAFCTSIRCSGDEGTVASESFTFPSSQLVCSFADSFTLHFTHISSIHVPGYAHIIITIPSRYLPTQFTRYRPTPTLQLEFNDNRAFG